MFLRSARPAGEGYRARRLALEAAGSPADTATAAENGSWAYLGKQARLRSSEDYDQIETFRVLALLVAKYGLNKRHPAIRRAAEYLFSCQTTEGDFRGIYGNQYTPNYSELFWSF